MHACMHACACAFAHAHLLPDKSTVIKMGLRPSILRHKHFVSSFNSGHSLAPHY